MPENSTVEALLSQFIEHKTHMAVVLDEYGGASGIVSLENITEELFGQIQDEFDRERPEIEPIGNGRYRVRGDYLIEDLADRLKIDVGEPAEETIGGYVAARLGREVAPGDKGARRSADRGARSGALPRALGDGGDADRRRWSWTKQKRRAEDPPFLAAFASTRQCLRKSPMMVCGRCYIVRHAFVIIPSSGC